MHLGRHAMNMQVEDRKQLAEAGSLLLCGWQRKNRGSSDLAASAFAAESSQQPQRCVLMEQNYLLSSDALHLELQL